MQFLQTCQICDNITKEKVTQNEFENFQASKIWFLKTTQNIFFIGKTKSTQKLLETFNR